MQKTMLMLIQSCFELFWGVFYLTGTDLNDQICVSLCWYSPSSVCVTAFSSGMKAGAKMTGYTMFLNFTSIPKSTDDIESEAATDTDD